MATQTPNYNFDLREGTDIFNPLSSNSNWESLDTLLKTIQETGGITTYTTTASANLLKLSGTPVANDTVFKFVAAGNANTWTAASGGVINNIVGLNGVQMTIKGGNMYVAWINSANAMVCVVWPDVVNAQMFDGKGPDEWATKVQLDAVNTTAGNATQTAQAAATVANQANTTAQQALTTAQTAGLTLTLLWENSSPKDAWTAQNVILNNYPDNTKFLLVEMWSGSASASDSYAAAIMLADVTVGQYIPFTYYKNQKVSQGARFFRKNSNTDMYIGIAYDTVGQNNIAIPTKIWAVS